jgi:hypothetical protein
MNTMPTTPRPANATFIARLGNLAQWITDDAGSMQTVAAELRHANGGGVPSFEKLVTETKPTPVRGLTVDATGATRSQADFDTAVASGFAPKQALYTRGTMVVQAGVDNARRARQEFDALPLVTDYCVDFKATIAAEERRDMTVGLGDVRMTSKGNIALGRVRLATEDRGLQGIVTRLGCGGAKYLRDGCTPELRAININRQAVAYRETEEAAHKALTDAGETTADFAPAKVVLRTRKAAEGRSTFAAVSESYTPFDVDKVAEAIERAVPAEARGTVNYDGTKARFEVNFHTNTKPEDFVAGEFFDAACIVEAQDDGSGSIKVSAAVKQNLCLNLIIIDAATSLVGNIRHVGDVDKLAAKFRTAFADALKKIEPFMKRWGYACKDNALVKALVAAGEREHDDDTPVDVRAALPGLFDAIIDTGTIPVKSNGRKRADIVADLVAMHDKDIADGSSAVRGGIVSRAAVVNAFTRYAHEVEGAKFDTFNETDIERAAGAMLANTKRPLPYHTPKWLEASKSEATATA